MQLLVSWSMTLSVTLEDSAPIATGTFAFTSFVAAELDTVMSLLSPESVAGRSRRPCRAHRRRR
ncbi:hypothetical protein P9139_01365 [Curtobacterium flaccumfaciens]|nr:hypothetical protein P9139_01365 [Curtobacterium flaccumfaciens]